MAAAAPYMCVHAVGPLRQERRAHSNRQHRLDATPAKTCLFGLVRAWRQRCQPRWRDEERRRKAMTALNPTFAKLGVRDEIVRALAENGIDHPFAIQELTLPLALAGDDLIGQARTGMGKTFAFGVPLLQRIFPTTRRRPDRPLAGAPRALVVVPTRELCIQVSGDLRGRGQIHCEPGRSPAERRLDLRRPRVRAPDRGAARRSRRGRRHARPAAGPRSATSPAARWPVRAGARRGRRDAGPRVPARHRTHPAPDPRASGRRCCSRRPCPTRSSRWPARS